MDLLVVIFIRHRRILAGNTYADSAGYLFGLCLSVSADGVAGPCRDGPRRNCLSDSTPGNLPDTVGGYSTCGNRPYGNLAGTKRRPKAPCHDRPISLGWEGQIP